MGIITEDRGAREERGMEEKRERGRDKQRRGGKMGEDRQVEIEPWTDCKRQTGRVERATAR